MNVVIDTNIYLGFIENLDLSTVNRFVKLSGENKIELLLPKVIEDEFLKLVDGVIHRTKKSYPQKGHNIEAIKRTIDQLFLNATKVPTISDGVYEWVNSLEAPNHNNAANYEDTFWLNSLCRFPNLKNSSLVIISNDISDLSDHYKQNLHSDIVGRFKKSLISVVLKTSARSYINNLGIDIGKKYNLRRDELYDWSYAHDLNETRTILSQLKFFDDYYYRELEFIPLEFLRNCYPFNSGTEESTYYERGKLVTDNEELFKFFKEVIFEHENGEPSINTENLEDQKDIAILSNVIDRLNKNLVLNLGYKDEILNIDFINLDPDISCRCEFCLLDRFDYKELLGFIKNGNNDKSHKDLIRKAYISYRLFELETSLNYLQKIKTFPVDQYSLSRLIADYNIEVLKYSWESNSDGWFEIQNGLKLYKETEFLRTADSIQAHIHYSRFFDSAFFDVTKQLDQVLHRFKINQGPGRSRIFGVEKRNLTRFIRLAEFCEKNGLFFGYYTNYKEFVSKTFKICLVTSMDPETQTEIPFYILKKAFTDLNSKQFRECFRDKHISTLKYSDNYNSWILDLISNQIKNFNYTIQNLNRTPFYYGHLDQIEKIIFLTSKLNIGSSKKNEIFSSLLDVTTNDAYALERVLICFNQIINKNSAAQIVNRSVARILNKCYIGLLPDAGRFPIDNYLNLLRAFPSLKVNKSIVDLVFESNRPLYTFNYNSYTYYWLYQSSSVKLKKQLLGQIHIQLNNQDYFDYKTYYLFCFYEIIDHSEVYFSKFKTLCIKQAEKIRSSRAKDDLEYRQDLGILFYYLDYCFQFKSVLVEDFSFMEGLDPYLDFLINPNSFDLDDINPYWLNYIKRPHRLEKSIFSTNEKIRQKLAEKVLLEKNPALERQFTALISRV